MPLLRESVTHWPINWQSALIPSPSQELFFWSLFCRADNVRERERESGVSRRNISLSHDCTDSTWNTSLTASFKHASYEPRTNIQTSDAKETLSHSHSFTPATCCVVKRSFVIHLCCLKYIVLGKLTISRNAIKVIIYEISLLTSIYFFLSFWSMRQQVWAVGRPRSFFLFIQW